MRKTKIVCTLGPSTNDPEIVESLIKNGMNVARFNFSHATHEEHEKRYCEFCEVRDRLGIPVATMLDTKGPEVRVKNFVNNSVMLKKGQLFTLTTDDIQGTEDKCSITYKDLPKDVIRGTKILIDDGLVGLEVEQVLGNDIVCKVLNDGKVSNNKGINVPNVRLSMPFLSKKDMDDIKFGVELGFDFIAASFVRTARDVLDIREYLASLGNTDIKIISKIENMEGVRNADDILSVSDGLMVARGDLGVEVPLEDIPVIQKDLIKKVYNAGKQVITATQMLDSMIKNPRPTRAEATDVANAIYDGTSAIMLSGETANGLYPVEAVKTMARIAERTEADINYIHRFSTRLQDRVCDITNAISHATCTTAHDLGAKAIVTVTKSGRTAREISKFRPVSPIVAFAMSKKVCRQMNLSWGVYPLILEEKANTDELFADAVEEAKNAGYVNDGDLVVITAGVPLGVSGSTNLLKVDIVGQKKSV